MNLVVAVRPLGVIVSCFVVIVELLVDVKFVAP